MGTSTTFSWFVLGWSVLLVGLLAIGGFFMFRKFLKSMPKQDGKSDLDWQDHFIEQTHGMWTDETRNLLEELIEPVPQIFRDAARRTIAGKIGQLAIEEKAHAITTELLVKGYIMATPKRDHKFLIKRLEEKQINYEPFQKYLKA
ncbi:DUF2621 family protein [Brevibacillus fluminis]|uniref:DUF2621 family protein n=1 Tax=Brevibacillus fluminis TaxID=511487 RepID=A0A3M8DAS5_9BACL|nr:DUF2621 family protein [Brevibacillus fluminis]RNB85154.1 DUF2621 family protein [Brevibacillus fluminis]